MPTSTVDELFGAVQVCVCARARAPVCLMCAWHTYIHTCGRAVWCSTGACVCVSVCACVRARRYV
jgi:hypothetical protein